MLSVYTAQTEKGIAIAYPVAISLGYEDDNGFHGKTVPSCNNSLCPGHREIQGIRYYDKGWWCPDCFLKKHPTFKIKTY